MSTTEVVPESRGVASSVTPLCVMTCTKQAHCQVGSFTTTARRDYRTSASRQHRGPGVAVTLFVHSYGMKCIAFSTCKGQDPSEDHVDSEQSYKSEVKTAPD